MSPSVVSPSAAEGAGAVGRRGLRTVLARATDSVVAQVRRTVADGLELLVPAPCPGCGGAGPWCATCAASVGRRPRQVELPEATVDRFAAARLPVPTVYGLSRYRGAARAVILAGKERGRRDLPPLVANALSAALSSLQRAGSLPGEVWLVPAPTKRAAARARGGDPVSVMARRAAQLLAERGQPTGVAACLFTAARARDSVGLDAAARAANLRGSVRFDRRARPPSDATIVLVDDVLTSGATVFQSCRVLGGEGFSVTVALIIASVPPLRPILVPPPAR